MDSLVPVDFQQLLEEHKEWFNQPYPRFGKVVWNKQERCIELYVYPGGTSYDIDLDRCKTKEDLLDWIFHLTEKIWYKDVAYDLLMMFKEVLPHNLLFRS